MNPSCTSRFRRILQRSILPALALISPMAQGANINWGAAQNITGESNVSTTGTLLGAFNVGDIGVPSTTVNGVSFQSFQAPAGNGTVGNFSTTSGTSFASNTAAGSPSAPFSGLTAAYQTLLMSRVALLSPLTLTISGLVSGTQYQFQCWSNNSSNANQYTTTATAGNSVDLTSNVNGLTGGLGQFVIGSFTADAAMQTVTFSPDEAGYLNAFQLRQLSGPTNGVPDSGSTIALLALALGSFIFVRRSFRRRDETNFLPAK